MSCWLASADMIFRYYDLPDALPDDLQKLYELDEGIAHWQLSLMASKFGFDWVPEPAYWEGGFSGWGSLGRIENELKARGPLWCSGRFGSKDEGQVGVYPHCIVVVGISEDGRVEYNDPEKKRYPLKMDVGKFEERLWKESGPFGDAVLYKKRRPPPKPLPVPPGH